METVLVIPAIISIIVGIIGWLWITVVAFSEGEILWGIGCLLLSPISIVYGLMNYQELKVPFFMVLGGFLGRFAIGALAVALS